MIFHPNGPLGSTMCMMIFHPFVNQNKTNFISPHYQKEHSPTRSGTLNSDLPPGYIGNFDVNERKEFIESQRARKYTRWDVAEEDNLEIDQKSKKIKQKKSGYIIDESEQY